MFAERPHYRRWRLPTAYGPDWTSTGPDWTSTDFPGMARREVVEMSFEAHRHGGHVGPDECPV